MDNNNKYISNEAIYRLQIPVKTIFDFQGEGMYEETLENHFVYCIIKSLEEKAIDYKVDYHTFEAENEFCIELRLNIARFEEEIIVRNVKNEGLLNGLIVKKLEYGNWIEIYNNLKTKYNNK
ncbi:MAG: hypothetical protein ABJG68_10605 [Crocinitomicaceae bacterium]